MKILLKSFMIMISLVAAFSLLPGGNARALTFDSEGNYQLGGYIQQYAGIRLTDMPKKFGLASGGGYESGDLSIFRTELFLDLDARFSDEIQFKAIARGHYEGVYGIDSDVNQNPDGRSTTPGPDTLDHVSDWDFREYYMTVNKGDWVVKFGRQQVAWGEADAIRIADIINPLDLSWRWSFPTWEEIRVPLHMINAAYNVPDSAYDLRFEAVYVPADFRPHQFAPQGANWSLYDNLEPNLAAPAIVVHDIVFNQQKADLPERDLSNGQGGVRVKAKLGGWDTALFVYVQRDPLGVHTSYPDFFATYKWHFPYITTIGGSFNVYCEWLETVFRSEFGYIFDQPYAPNPANPAAFFTPDYEESDTFHYMLGFDYNAMLPFLNRTKSFFVSGQFYQKFILDIDEDQWQTFVDDDDSGDFQTIVSLLINTEYYEGKIIPQVLGVSFITEESGFFEGTLAYKPTYTLSFTVGYLNIWGNTNRAGLYFGPIKDNDEVFAKVKWSF